MDEKLVEIKESAILYLDRFEAELPKFVLELRAANTLRLGILADIIEGVEWLIDVVRVITDINDDTADRIVDALDAMEGAVKNHDYTLIADILEYEIQEITAQWRYVFTR